MQDTLIQRRAIPDTQGLPDTLPPLLRRIYAARKAVCEQDLARELAALTPVDRLAHAKQAAAMLADAIEGGQRILIVGDFDADGATSSTLSVLALRAMGAAWVDYLVPNRFEYGYGLTPEIVAVAAERQPDLIVTVDNGIASLDGVAAARKAGMEVLVTDHHLPGERLPEAACIVNPNLPEDDFPGKSLAGVGVIFYVLLALRAALRERGWFGKQGIPEPNMAAYLDLVALGTVADVVPLERDNRILVEQGLRRIRAGQCRPGITALLQAAGRDPSRVVAADMGFAVGPRLNAAGRLDDMSQGIECLLSDDPEDARQRAGELDRLNRERRAIESDMQQQALAALDSLADLQEEGLPFGLCLYREDWHQGVIGILASRIKDRYHRPVIAFAPGDHGLIKGSARSVPGVHIRDVLDAVATRHPHLLEKFGGHAMAAGMSLALENYDAFQQAFDAEVRRHLAAEDIRGVIHSDGELAAEDFNLQMAACLRDGGPWGQAFPEPLFDGRFRVIHQRVLQDKHYKLVVAPLDDPGRTLDAIAFRQVEEHGERLPEEVHLAYRLDINHYRGESNLQLIAEKILIP